MIIQFDTIYIVLIIVWIIVSIIALIIGYKKTSYDLDDRIKTLGIISIIGLISLAIVILLARKNYAAKEADYYKKVEQKASTYSVYVDGSQVNSDKLHIKDYDVENIHIDDKKKEIHITKWGLGMKFKIL